MLIKYTLHFTIKLQFISSCFPEKEQEEVEVEATEEGEGELSEEEEGRPVRVWEKQSFILKRQFPVSFYRMQV